MVNFILQEAHEKANEIRIKTEHDFNIEKQMLVHNAKLAIAEDYKHKDREREVQERIQRSTAVGDARVTKMKLRDDLLTKLVQTAKESVAGVVNTPAYPDLLKKLIVQGLIKIEEDDVVVLCRSADVMVCQSVAQDAVKLYVETIKAQTGQVVNPTVKVNTDPKKMLPDHKCCGGVTLTACHGRIVCAPRRVFLLPPPVCSFSLGVVDPRGLAGDNTLDARVGLVYDELLPTIREQLWEGKK